VFLHMWSVEYLWNSKNHLGSSIWKAHLGSLQA
jgi:hypothetical protein